MNVFRPFFLLLLSASITFSQQAEKSVWTEIASNDGEFRVSLPGEMLVFEDDLLKTVTLSSSVTDASFKVVFGSDPNPRFKPTREAKAAEGFVSSAFSGKDFKGEIFILKKKIYRVELDVSTSSGSYSVEAWARDPDNRFLSDFLSSISVRMTRIIDRAGGSLVPDRRVSVKELKTSSKIIDILARKRTGSPKLQKGKIDIDLDVFYSQPLLFLSKPRPRYDDLARQNNIQGTVGLQVQFKSDGEIGDIWAAKGPPALFNVAVEAAKKIRFLPAEIDGKPVDVIREVEYTFSIY
jgi:hypothetical protein